MNSKHKDSMPMELQKSTAYVSNVRCKRPAMITSLYNLETGRLLESVAESDGQDVESDVDDSESEQESETQSRFEPYVKPVNGIVQPPVMPTDNRPGRSTNVLKSLAKVLKDLSKSSWSCYFRHPVDTIRLGVPDYHNVIKRPMDLTTIKRRLQNNYYWNAKEALADFELIFDNCMLYNLEGTEVNTAGKKLRAQFYKKLSQLDMENEVELMPQESGSGKRHNSEKLMSNKRQKQQPQIQVESVDTQTEAESKQEHFEYHKLMDTAKELEIWSGFLIEKKHCLMLLKCLTKKKRNHINWPFNSNSKYTYNEGEIFQVNWQILGDRLKRNQYESFNDFVRVIQKMLEKALFIFHSDKPLVKAVMELGNVLIERLPIYHNSIAKMKMLSERFSIAKTKDFNNYLSAVK